MEAKEERNNEDVSLTAADDADDADDADGRDVALSTGAESNIIAETPTKSSHTFAATQPRASAFAAADDDEASGGPHINAASSAEETNPSWRSMAKAADDIKRSLSRANRDLDTSESSMRVKFSVRCFTRVGMSLEFAADWKEDVYLGGWRLKRREVRW